MEGVMMRSPHYLAVAVRKPGGKIKVKQDYYLSVVTRMGLSKIPIARGMVGFFEMMIVGLKALNFSTRESLEEDDQEATEKSVEKNNFRQSLLEVVSLVLSLALALGLGLGLFKFLPLLLTELLSRSYPLLGENYWFYNLVDGTIKIVFFITYIALIGLLPDLRRVFAYHGAEHKVIRAYEADQELTPANAAKMSRFHPRCGTSFVLVVFVISIIVYTIIPAPAGFAAKLTMRIAVLPLIAGVAYEFLKWSARHENAWWLKLAITPGLWLQKLTTREPDHEQLAVAIAALKSALDGEKQRSESL